jgi:DHA1 family inner membrane transport protein
MTTDPVQPFSTQDGRLALMALSVGSFAIGTSEFASMGILQLFSQTLGIDLSRASNVISAYALGVVVGAPLITLLAARLNRRTLLIALMLLFVAGNLLSAAAGGLLSLIAARFLTGLAQGAYFGAGALVATFVVGPQNAGKAFSLVVAGLTVSMIVGSPLATYFAQNLGWRATYVAVAALGVLALLAIASWVPRSEKLGGQPVIQEFAALAKPRVWLMMSVAATAVASIFAVYTFIGPFVTEAAELSSGFIPAALALFGVGMTIGNLVGGLFADKYPVRGLIMGFGLALVVLVVLGSGGGNPYVLMVSMFGVGLTTMIAIPTIQVRLTRLAPEAPTLMGAMNMAALNLSNAIGAWAGGATIAAGLGVLSPAWAGVALTVIGLLLFGAFVHLEATRTPTKAARAEAVVAPHALG